MEQLTYIVRKFLISSSGTYCLFLNAKSTSRSRSVTEINGPCVVDRTRLYRSTSKPDCRQSRPDFPSLPTYFLSPVILASDRERSTARAPKHLRSKIASLRSRRISDQIASVLVSPALFVCSGSRTRREEREALDGVSGDASQFLSCSVSVFC